MEGPSRKLLTSGRVPGWASDRSRHEHPGSDHCVGWRVEGRGYRQLDYFCNFSVSLKLSQKQPF